MGPDIPPSFQALYGRQGAVLPHARKLDMLARYEICEDLAQMMVDTSRTLLLQLGVAEADVLQRCHQGLLVPESGLSPDEATWVARRLAELNAWPDPWAPA